MEAQLETTTQHTDSPIPHAIFTTDRLIIRPMHPQDSTSMSLNANDPLVAKYLTLAFGHPYTLAHAKTWIDMNITKLHQDNFVVCEKASPETAIGGVRITPGTDVKSHTAEVGFWIGSSYWGKGFTTEVLQGLTKWVFLDREVEGKRITRLCGSVFSGNVASMRCFEKCGYPREGVLKGHCEKHGETFDLHLFGLTRADWEEQTSGR